MKLALVFPISHLMCSPQAPYSANRPVTAHFTMAKLTKGLRMKAAPLKPPKSTFNVG